MARPWPALLLSLLAGMALAEPDSQRQAELRYLLSQDCGSCHGLTLRGGLGPALLPETLSGKPANLLEVTVLHGRPGTAMPPWAGLLSADEVRWLVRELLAGSALQ